MSAELQKSIYDALNAANIPGIVAIVDAPIRDTTDSDYPFIEIADSQQIPNDASKDDGTTDTGVDEFIDIHSWSRYRGQREVKEIMQAVYAALHHLNLTVTGRTTAFCWLDDSRVTGDPDGLTRHGIQTFRITHRNRS